MARSTVLGLLVAFLLAALPAGGRAQETVVEFSGFPAGTVLAHDLGHRGLLLSSSENAAGPEVQVEPDLQAVLVPSLAGPPADSPIETISLHFVGPRDGTSPATTAFVEVMTDVGPGNTAMLQAFSADGRPLAVAVTGPTGGPRGLRVAADGIATARFTATFDETTRGCIGAVTFADPVTPVSPTGLRPLR